MSSCPCFVPYPVSADTRFVYNIYSSDSVDLEHIFGPMDDFTYTLDALCASSHSSQLDITYIQLVRGQMGNECLFLPSMDSQLQGSHQVGTFPARSIPPYHPKPMTSPVEYVNDCNRQIITVNVASEGGLKLLRQYLLNQGLSESSAVSLSPPEGVFLWNGLQVTIYPLNKEKAQAIFKSLYIGSEVAVDSLSLQNGVVSLHEEYS